MPGLARMLMGAAVELVTRETTISDRIEVDRAIDGNSRDVYKAVLASRLEELRMGEVVT